jgi:RNA-binding protein
VLRPGKRRHGDTREAAIALSRPTHSAVVQVIGHRFVLYRETHRDDVEKIQLVH